jgi:hypothetical protein
MSQHDPNQLELMHKKRFISLCVDAHIEVLKVLSDQVAQKTLTVVEIAELYKAKDILEHYSRI